MRMKWIAVILAVVVAAGAVLGWALTAPRPRYSAEEWQALSLAGDPAAGRLVFFAGGCES
ncbi:MAG: alkylated DNA repair protein, partial [Hyphomicrobiales bacterium]|nr:alkylated DNA repair protein [Hyphomicrobiales bacterium]